MSALRTMGTLAAALLAGAAITAAPAAADTDIVGGRPATKGEFPHQLSLRDSFSGKHFCGASILDKYTALTAAHCVADFHGDASKLYVVAGSNLLDRGGVKSRVKKIVTHKQYDAQRIVNDIAILKLSSGLTFGSAVAAVPLATSDPSAGSQVTLSGWGLTSFPGTIPNALQTLTMHVLGHSACVQQNPTDLPISAGNLCTISPKGKGACKGDSGGPLVAGGKQVGVVSWGVPCAKGYPDVFTSVSAYAKWIQQNR
ncbi:serine protease [Amycolatopsis sp. NPDC058986]|uniref:serine protease n=1 Tax=unclassified Amycolatopsis TaxID=2618356 RepID=UPI00366AB2D7